MEQISEANTL